MEKVSPTKRPRYDAAFRAEALRLASESRSTLTAARALNIDAKRFYAWQKAAQQPLPTEPAEAAEVRALRAAHKRRYGTRRLQVELREKGYQVGRQVLRTGLRRHQRRALQPKAFAPRTTDSTHGQRCALNLLLDQPRPTQANRVWVSFITYLPSANDTLAYWCAFQGMCTKHVVGWQVRVDMLYPLVNSALQWSLLAQRSASGLIVHPDRGGQYVGKNYKALLREAKVQLSHSRRGECYDNAQAESLWSRLKTEELEAHDWPVFADLADAQGNVSEYFDYYNHDRRHSSIGYLKSYQFHQQQFNSITQFSPA